MNVVTNVDVAARALVVAYSGEFSVGEQELEITDSVSRLLSERFEAAMVRASERLWADKVVLARFMELLTEEVLAPEESPTEET